MTTLLQDTVVAPGPWPVRRPGGTTLQLLGGFSLHHGGAVLDVPWGGQRLLAFLAIHPRPLSRSFVAGSLWPDTSDRKACANLRTTLWRLHGLAAVVAATPATLALDASVCVDTHHLEAVARSLVGEDDPGDVSDLDPADLAGELLPEHWDTWLLFERERLRQLSLHALEALSRHLSAQGRHTAAVLAGIAAVEAEPLRETANRALVEAHLAEGNVAEAVRHYRRFEDLLRRELGVEPHPELAARLASLRV